MIRRGLSLVDVIFTASLLALVFMVLMSIFPTAMFSVRQTEHRQVAASVALAVIDECRSGPFLPLASNGNYDVSSAGPLGDYLRRQRLTGADGLDYVPSLSVTAVNGSSVPRESLAQITVTVRWKEKGRDLDLVRTLAVAALNR
jgi:hypothetical protein